MKEYKTSNVKNIAILGHLGSGKTSFGEAMLFAGKAIDKKGEVERKTTVSDYTAEEQARQTSLNSTLLPLEWKGYKINALDTPGSEEFIGDIENVLSAVEGAVVLIDATKGVEVGTERVWGELVKKHIPTIIFINKMDKENVKFDEDIADIKDALSKNALPFAWEIGSTNNFKGVASVLDNIAKLVDGDKTKDADIPADVAGKVEEIKAELTEKAAEASEELMEKYFEAMELSAEDMVTGLKESVHNCEIFPILVGSGLKNVGVDLLLDTIINFIPSAAEAPLKKATDGAGKEITRKVDVNEPFSAFVFKTTIDPFVGTISYFKVLSGQVKLGIDAYIPELDTSVKFPGIFTMMGKNQLPLDVANAGDIACVAKIAEFANGLTFCDKKSPIVYAKPEYPTPVIYVAIAPKNKQDEDKLSSS